MTAGATTMSRLCPPIPHLPPAVAEVNVLPCVVKKVPSP
jgi:hypothetical protein